VTAFLIYFVLIIMIFSILEAKNRFMNNSLFLKESQNAAEVGSYSLDFQTMFWESSEMLDKIFGIQKEYERSLNGWTALIYEEDRQMMQKYFLEEISLQRKSFNKKYRIIRQNDQEIRWVHGLGKLQFDNQNKLIKMIGTIQDITEQQNLLKTITDQQKKYELFLHLASDGIFILSDDGKLLEYNQEAKKLLGYSDDEMKKLHVYDWDISHTPQEALLHVKNTPYTPLSFETKHKRKDGTIYEASIKVVKIHVEDKDYIYASVRDITQNKDHERQLIYTANYDALTGLPNRLLNADRLRQAMAQAERREGLIAVLYLDLDGFKSINDQYGHATGDKLLSAVALQMKATLREGDTLSRLGGDEFVAILTDLADHSTAVAIITRAPLKTHLKS
jgi:PAS domain S-box-containing protein